MALAASAAMTDFLTSAGVTGLAGVTAPYGNGYEGVAIPFCIGCDFMEGSNYMVGTALLVTPGIPLWSNQGCCVGQWPPSAVFPRWDYADITLHPPDVPIPPTALLFVTGLGGLGLLGWRRKRKRQAV
jgi:hypothetical protein